MARLLLVITLALSVLGGAGYVLIGYAGAIFGRSQPVVAQAPAPPKPAGAKILVAARPLLPGATVAAEDVRFADLPEASVPTDAYRHPSSQPRDQPWPAGANLDRSQPAEALVDAVKNLVVGRTVYSFVAANSPVVAQVFDQRLLRPVLPAQATGPTRETPLRLASEENTLSRPREAEVEVAQLILVRPARTLSGARWVEIETVLQHVPLNKDDLVPSLRVPNEDQAKVTEAAGRGELYIVSAGWRPDTGSQLCVEERCLYPAEAVKGQQRLGEPVPVRQPAAPPAGAAPTQPPAPGQVVASRPNLDRALAQRPQRPTPVAPPGTPPATATN